VKSKILTVLLSLAIAIGVWFYVVTVVSPNANKSFYDIRVELMGEGTLEKQGLMITNVSDLSTVTLRLEGNRIDLNKLSSDNINITLDVSKLSSGGVYDLPYSITYPTSNAFVVLNKEPGFVQVRVEEKLEKEVPVKVKLPNDPAEGYKVDNRGGKIEKELEPVKITGPKSVVDKIDHALVVIDLQGRKDSLLGENFSYTLCSKDGTPVDAKSVVTNKAEIPVSATIGQVKTIPLDVNIIAGGGATRDDCEYTLTTESIQIFGTVKELEKLGDKLVLGDVDLGAITLAEDTKTYENTFALPENLDFWNEDDVVSMVKVTVVFKNLEETELTVSKFEPINIPEGLQVADIVPQFDSAILRVPKDIIKNISAENVIAEVDCSEATVGSKIVKVTFRYGDTQLNALGSYTVSVVLEEKEEPSSES